MKDHLGFKLLPDVLDEPVFMLQTMPSEDPSCPLLVFYDCGCSTAVLSDRAHSLNPIVVSKGPTAVDVAGGKTIVITYGDERFHLQVEDGDRVKATPITGLRMPHVTNPFPLVKLKEAWLDACDHAKKIQPNLCLPAVGGWRPGGGYLAGDQICEVFSSANLQLTWRPADLSCGHICLLYWIRLNISRRKVYS